MKTLLLLFLCSTLGGCVGAGAFSYDFKNGVVTYTLPAPGGHAK